MNVVLAAPRQTIAHSGNQTYSDRLFHHLQALGCTATQVFLPDEREAIFENIGEIKPNLIQAFHAIKSGVVCLRACKIARLPLVVTCTGTDVFVDLYTPGLGEQVANVLFSASHVIVPFSGMLPVLREKVPGLRHFTVIPKGLWGKPSQGVLNRAQFGLKESDRIFLISGGIRPVKNTLFAIQYLETIREKYPDIKLVIIGPIIHEEYAQRLLELLPENPWVKWVPSQPWKDMPLWYEAAEIVLNVSHVEGISNTLLEAMSLGTPVLAADIPANRAIITSEFFAPENGTGLLYFTSGAPMGYTKIHDADDFCAKVKFLLDNPAKAREIGQRGAIWVRANHRPDREAYQHLQLYHGLFKGR